MAKDKVKDDKKKAKKSDKEEKPDKKDKRAEKADKGDKKEKKEKKEKGADVASHDDDKSTAAGSAASTHGGQSATGTDPNAALFAKFDVGGKGYLDKADVQKLLHEVGSGGAAGGQTYPSVAPRVGPFASSVSGLFPMLGQPMGTGASIYGPSGLGRTPFGGTGRFSTPGRPGLPPVSSAGPLMQPGYGGYGQQGVAGQGGGADPSAVALAQAYQTRMAALSSVAASLLGKRESLAHTLARVQARAAEVGGAREAIEAETLGDAEAVLHRLRAAESTKQAILQRDAEVLAGDMSAIDRFYAALTSFQPHGASSNAMNNNGGVGGGGSMADFGGGVDAAFSTASGMGGLAMGMGSGPVYDPATALEFMRAYPELCAEADRLTGKPVKTDMDVRSDDFERETASRCDLAGRYAALVDLVAAKDRIILQLLKERESVALERESVKAVLERASSDRQVIERDKQGEVEHWMRVADKLTGELNEVMDRMSRAQGQGPSGPHAEESREGGAGYGRGGVSGHGIAASAHGRLSFGVPLSDAGNGLLPPVPASRRAGVGMSSGPAPSAFSNRSAPGSAPGSVKMVPGLRPEVGASSGASGQQNGGGGAGAMPLPLPISLGQSTVQPSPYLVPGNESPMGAAPAQFIKAVPPSPSWAQDSAASGDAAPAALKA